MSHFNSRNGLQAARSASRPVLPTNSNLMERMFLRKREQESRKAAEWDSTAKYFDRLNSQNKVFESLSTPESVERSAASYSRMKLAEIAQGAEHLNGGHERPPHVARRDERRFVEEVNSGIVHQGVTDMKNVKALFADQRRMEQEREARELLEYHRKINDPGFKELISKKSTAFVKLPPEKSEDSCITKPPPQVDDDNQEDQIEESRKFVEEETKKFDSEVVENVRKLEDGQLERWREAIMKYIEDSKALKEKEEKLLREVSQDASLDVSIDLVAEKRRKLAQKWIEREREPMQSRQYRLMLHAKSAEVEAELEEDRRLVEELANLLRCTETTIDSPDDDLVDWTNKVKIHLDHLTFLKAQEAKSRYDWGFLFSEEAAKMWHHHNQKWADSRLQRQNRFHELFTNIKESLRVQLQRKRRALETCQASRQTVEEAVERLTQELQEEEEREMRRRQVRQHQEAQLQLEDLEFLTLNGNEEKAQLKGPQQLSADQRFRYKNEVASHLAGWSREKQEVEYGDFRRKKVKWFD